MRLDFYRAWNIETSRALTLEDLAIIAEGGESPAIAIRSALGVTLRPLSEAEKGLNSWSRRRCASATTYSSAIAKASR